MDMDKIIKDIKPVGEVKIEDKKSLGLLALEYSSSSSDDEDVNMETVKRKAGLNNTKVSSGAVENNVSEKKHVNFSKVKASGVDYTETAAEVNLMEYVANLNKMQLPGNVSAIENSTLKDVRSQEKIDCANKASQKVENFNEYRTQPPIVELSSSEDSESDSTGSLDSDSSDSSSEEVAVVNADEKDEENDEETHHTDKNSETKEDPKKVRKEKTEFDNLPPIEDLKISVPEVLADPMGKVAWFAEQMVVVKPKPEKPTLNLDTVLFLERGSRVLGRVFDVFGPVKEPYYCVRFNDEEHIKESNVKIGMTVYYCPNSPYTTLVFLSELSKMRGTDTIDYSEHPEFSDDEEENAYYAALRRNSHAQKNVQKTSTNENSKRPRMSEGQAGWQKRNNQPRQRFPNPEQPCYQQMYMPRQPQYMMQQAPFAPCLVPPAMQQYPMNQYYRPNTYSPYSFGYQNWPPQRAPFYNNYSTPPPPPPPTDAPGSPYHFSQHNSNQSNRQ